MQRRVTELEYIHTQPHTLQLVDYLERIIFIFISPTGNNIKEKKKLN